MWGSKQGWIISACIAVAMGALLLVAATPPGTTPPTGQLALALKPADVPTNPTTVVPNGTKNEDAGDLYRQAIEEYLRHKDQYENWHSKLTDADKAKPKAVQLVVDAAPFAKMTLFSRQPEELINYNNERPTLDALESIGTLTHQLGFLYAKTKRPEEARRYAEATFALGYHLYTERVRFSEWSDGIEMMGNATSILIAIDPSREDTLKDFIVNNAKYLKDDVQPIWQKISGIGTTDIALYAGDIFQIAKESPELMWRVEAEIKLGRYRFNAASRGDQLATKKVLTALANDPSPLVKTAATQAHDLTIEKYRMIGLSN